MQKRNLSLVSDVLSTKLYPVLIASLLSSFSAQAQNAIDSRGSGVKLGVEATATSSGVVPTLSIHTNEQKDLMVGGAVGFSKDEKDVVGGVSFSPTNNSALSFYGSVGKFKFNEGDYSASGFGVRFFQKTPNSFFDALGGGIDTKSVDGKVLSNTSTSSQSGYTTTVTRTQNEQPGFRMNTFSFSGVKKIEAGGSVVPSLGISTLDGKSGLYAALNYYTTNGNSIGFSTQHGLTSAHARLDVSAGVSSILNGIFNKNYIPTKEGVPSDDISLKHISLQESLSGGRLLGLSSLMPKAVNHTSIQESVNTSGTFVVDSKTITQDSNGNYILNIVPSLTSAGVKTLPSTQTIDIKNLLPPGAIVSSATITTSRDTPGNPAASVSVNGSNMSISIKNGTPPVNPVINFTVNGVSHTLVIKTMIGS